MEKVTVNLKVEINPEFLAALDRASAALELVRKISERDDLVTIERDVRIEE